MKPFRIALAVLSLCAAAPAFGHGGIADLSVYDRTEGRRLPVYWQGGRAYVAGRPGNEYQITLRSRQHEEVLAVVSVDGVNVVTGQGAEPSQSGYVLAPRGSLDIQGWRRNLGETAAFYFTSLGASYAARTGRPDNVGVIGVALFRKKAPPPPVPFSAAPAQSARSAAEPASGAAADLSRREERVGTGHGRREASRAVQVQFERATSVPAEIVTLYYDSHANLVARGIIREPGRQPWPAAPLPFPGFVPDPPA
jgi:hypothetical protein